MAYLAEFEFTKKTKFKMYISHDWCTTFPNGTVEFNEEHLEELMTLARAKICRDYDMWGEKFEVELIGTSENIPPYR